MSSLSRTRTDQVPVVILCGGRGTRIRSEAGSLPKPLVAVGRQPILWHIMKGYAHHGFGDFILCLGYQGYKIKEYFLNYLAMSRDFTVDLRRPDDGLTFHDERPGEDWRVTMAETGEDAMTGARVYRASRYFSGRTFMLTYGDGVSDVDLRQLLAFHRGHGRLCTVTGVHPPSRFGELIVREGQVADFSEKPQVRDGYINGGFMVCEPGVLDYVRDDDRCVFERDPMEGLARDGQLMMYRHEGFWQCMDTYRDLALLTEIWEGGKAPWKVWE